MFAASSCSAVSERHWLFSQNAQHGAEFHPWLSLCMQGAAMQSFRAQIIRLGRVCITRATELTFPSPSFCFIWLMQRISSRLVCSVSQTRVQGWFKCRFVNFFCCFFSEGLLRCRLRSVSWDTVPCILSYIEGCPQPGWVGHRQSTGKYCFPPWQRKLSFQEQHGLEWCPELWRRTYLSRILIFSLEFVSQPDIMGGGRKLPEILEKSVSDATALLS